MTSGGVANPQAGYEYTRIGGKRHHVCATITCRLPLIIGQAMDPIYTVPEVGDPHPWKKQAVCGPCYKAQHELVYPGTPTPDVKDAFLPGAEAIPHGWIDPAEAEPVDDDFALWRKALEQAEASQGAETVAQAYKRLLSVPEILGVEDQPDVVPVRE